MRKTRQVTAGFEEGRVPGAEDSGWPLEVGKQKNGFPLEPPEKNVALPTLCI